MSVVAVKLLLQNSQHNREAAPCSTEQIGSWGYNYKLMPLDCCGLKKKKKKEIYLNLSVCSFCFYLFTYSVLVLYQSPPVVPVLMLSDPLRSPHLFVWTNSLPADCFCLVWSPFHLLIVIEPSRTHWIVAYSKRNDSHSLALESAGQDLGGVADTYHIHQYTLLKAFFKKKKKKKAQVFPSKKENITNTKTRSEVVSTRTLSL